MSPLGSECSCILEAMEEVGQRRALEEVVGGKFQAPDGDVLSHSKDCSAGWSG